MDNSYRSKFDRLRSLKGLRKRCQLFLKILSSDLVERTRRHLSCGNTHFPRLHEHKFALEVEFLGDLVNANRHTAYKFRPKFSDLEEDADTAWTGRTSPPQNRLHSRRLSIISTAQRATC